MAQRSGMSPGTGGQAATDDRPLVSGPSLGPIPYHWVAAIVVCVGTFLGVVDNSITNIALPTLSTEFGRSTDDVIWVALSFIVVSTGLSLTMGRLGRHLWPQDAVRGWLSSCSRSPPGCPRSLAPWRN